MMNNFTDKSFKCRFPCNIQIDGRFNMYDLNGHITTNDSTCSILDLELLVRFHDFHFIICK